MNPVRLSVVVLVAFILMGGAVPSLCTNERQTQGGEPSPSIQGVDQAFYNYHTSYHRSEQSNYYPLDQSIAEKQKTILGVYGSQKNGGDEGSQILMMGPMDSAWPMMSHDIYHTGRSPYNTTRPPEGVEIWRFDASDPFDGGAIVDKDGILFFGDMAGKFYAVYPNGTLKWKTKLTAPSGFGANIDSTPAIDENGIIYIGTIWGPDGNYLYALNSSDGSVKWRHSTGNDVDSSPAIGTDGTIYFGDWSGYVHALHPDGTDKWKYHTGDVITGSPAIGPDGTVYIGSHDSSLYAFNPDNGTVKWRFYTGGWVRVSPCVGDDGTVYCVSFDNYLYAIYPNNGTMKWKTFVNAGTNPTIGLDGTIYAGWDVLYAINPDGSVKWTFPGYAAIEGGTPCTSREGIIYYGTTSGRLMALNPNGTLRWQRDLTQPCQSPPAIDSNGCIYIGSDSPGSAIHAFGQGPLRAEANGPYTDVANNSIQFTGDGFGGFPFYTYHWDFGDNHSADEQNPRHSYFRAGQYNAILTITDSQGNQSSDNTTVIITYPPPLITLTWPTSGFYFFDKKILPTRKIIAIGPITFEANVTQNPLPIVRVEFLINGDVLGTVTTPPYKWTWKTLYFGSRNVVARAYDSVGNKRFSDVITVWKFF